MGETSRQACGFGVCCWYLGGIFRNFPEYAQAVKALAPTTVNVIFSDVPPVYGSAVEAMHDLGLACTDSFREKFLSSYHG